MRILQPDQFVTMPWKNGGGITHEIAKLELDGKVAWRLSIAEVDSDGPFSSFPGLSRVLTVLEGEGLRLAGPDEVMTVLPFAPFAFSGDIAIQSTRISGKVRDFNVMFDPLRYAGEVTVRDKAEALVAHDNLMLAALIVTGGRVNDKDVAPMTCVILDSETAVIDSAGHVLLTELRPVHSS